MIDTPAVLDDPASRRPRPSTGRDWLHTVELGLCFLLMASLADVVGLVHEGRKALAGQRSPTVATRPLPDAAMGQERVIGVAARPATPR